MSPDEIHKHWRIHQNLKDSISVRQATSGVTFGRNPSSVFE